MNEEARKQRRPRRFLVLLGLLVATFCAWLFWPYPDPSAVQRDFVEHVQATGTMTLNSVDSASPWSLDVVDPEMGETAQLVRRTETDPETGRQVTYWPVLSSLRLNDRSVVAKLTGNLLPQRPVECTDSIAAARKRLDLIAKLMLRIDGTEFGQLFATRDPLAETRMACGFAPDFELVDPEDDRNTMMLCLTCLEVRSWYRGGVGSGSITMEIRDQYLAFAKEEGLEVSTKWREMEE